MPSPAKDQASPPPPLRNLMVSCPSAPQLAGGYDGSGCEPRNGPASTSPPFSSPKRIHRSGRGQPPELAVRQTSHIHCPADRRQMAADRDERRDEGSSLAAQTTRICVSESERCDASFHAQLGGTARGVDKRAGYGVSSLRLGVAWAPNSPSLSTHAASAARERCPGCGRLAGSGVSGNGADDRNPGGVARGDGHRQRERARFLPFGAAQRLAAVGDGGAVAERQDRR
jgi:hypothetical protein